MPTHKSLNDAHSISASTITTAFALLIVVGGCEELTGSFDGYVPCADEPDDGCPCAMQRTPTGTCIDVYEATIFERADCTGRRYGEFENDLPAGFPADVASADDFGNKEPSVAVFACSKPGVIPTGFVSWFQARRACQEAGKRLCHEDEWYRTCSGPDGWLFPYGSEWMPNCAGDPRSFASISELKDACVTCGEDTPDSDLACSAIWKDNEVLSAGALPDCKTTTGVHDLTGNRWEMIEDLSPDNGDARIFGGDSRWISTIPFTRCEAGLDISEDMLLTCDFSAFDDPASVEHSYGFRCCSD